MKSIVLAHRCMPGPIGLSVMGAIALTLASPGPVQAQIIPDATLPQASTTSLSGTTTTIGGGSQSGANLFHSFDQFSIAPGTTASFLSNSSIERILTRVTGNNASILEGNLTVLGSNADFFLLNPNGVFFGPNASLNLSGSFLATTAERLQFADGSFEAINPAPTALLSMSAPVGLQFGAAPAPIQVNGPGNGLTITQSSDIIKTNRPLGLQVQPQQTLALLGGPVVLDGGNLTGGDDTAGAGRVAIAAIGANSSLGLTNDALGWTLDSSNTANFSDVTLQNAASVDTSSLGGGPIEVYGQNIVLNDGSTLLSETLGGGSGGTITVEGREALVLMGISRDSSTGQPLFLSSIAAEVAIGATGQGGAVNITAPLVLLRDGAQISASTYGPGNSGPLTVNAQQLVLLGANAFGPSGLGSVVGFSSTGRSGDIQITADEIVGQGSGSITTFAFGPGQGGKIDINATSLDFSGGSPSGPSGIFAGAIQGQGGGLAIEADRITASGGAQISANTFGPGNGADITILAQDIELTGTSPSGLPTGILTGVEDAGATGDAGNISLQADRIRLADGARIAVNTLGAGDGGVLTIAATQVDLTGARLTPRGPRYSGLFATVDPTATGQGGVITLDVAALNVSDGARVLAATAGAGDAGDVTINANEVNLFGSHPLGPSSLLTSAIIGPGAGGTITVNANRFNATDGAVVSASNFLIGTSAPPGQGPAGTVIINADQVRLNNAATITTASAGGAEGNIQIQANILQLRRGASINTNALGSATGGNIGIDADFILAIADENSDITANAVDNRGGNIQIRTNNLFGIQPQASLTDASDITASSELGLAFAGSIVLNNLELDPTQGLNALPSTVDQSEKIAQSCPGEDPLPGGSFTLSGKGGLPGDLRPVLDSPALWQDSRQGSLTQAPAEQTSSAPQPAAVDPTVPEAITQPISEAQGLRRDRQGKIQLLASTTSPQFVPPSTCPS